MKNKNFIIRNNKKKGLSQKEHVAKNWNQKDFTILFCYWVDNGNGDDEKYVW